MARGGSWDYTPALCRSARRNWFAPGIRINDLGFRIALARSADKGQPTAAAAAPTISAPAASSTNSSKAMKPAEASVTPPALNRPESPKPVLIEGKQAGDTRDDNGLKLKLVWCPPGKFVMGSPLDEKDRSEDEVQVKVTLSRGFWLGQTEVTQGQVRQVLGIEPWKGGKYVKERPEYAASYVSWDEASEFCVKLTRSERTAGRMGTNEEYRLPTEAEWEYACRAGSATAHGFGDDPSQLSDYAWWGGLIGDGNAKTEQYAHAVGLKKANAWGLHDMHGNVYEWCQDWYDAKLPGGTDPENLSKSSNRVIRGGSWSITPASCRSAFRNWFAPEYRGIYLGFRIARSQSSR